MGIFLLLGFLGVLASLYAMYVERQGSTNKEYVALCDINNSMSCSRVLKSEYAKLGRFMFGLRADHPLNVPNTYFGLVFYIGVMMYSIYPFMFFPFSSHLLFFASVLSIGASCVLAYILAFVLRDVCLVCMTTYVINALILYYSWWEL